MTDSRRYNSNTVADYHHELVVDLWTGRSQQAWKAMRLDFTWSVDSSLASSTCKHIINKYANDAMEQDDVVIRTDVQSILILIYFGLFV